MQEMCQFFNFHKSMKSKDKFGIFLDHDGFEGRFCHQLGKACSRVFYIRISKRRGLSFAGNFIEPKIL